MNPQGTDMAGSPVALLGLVFLEVKPAPGPRTGYSVPSTETVTSSIGHAGTTPVGVARKSTSCKTRAYSSLIMRWTFIALE